MADWLLCVVEAKRFAPEEFDGTIHIPADGSPPHDRVTGVPAAKEPDDEWHASSSVHDADAAEPDEPVGNDQ